MQIQLHVGLFFQNHFVMVQIYSELFELTAGWICISNSCSLFLSSYYIFEISYDITVIINKVSAKCSLCVSLVAIIIIIINKNKFLYRQGEVLENDSPFAFPLDFLLTIAICAFTFTSTCWWYLYHFYFVLYQHLSPVLFPPCLMGWSGRESGGRNCYNKKPAERPVKAQASHLPSQPSEEKVPISPVCICFRMGPGVHEHSPSLL